MIFFGQRDAGRGCLRELGLKVVVPIGDWRFPRSLWSDCDLPRNAVFFSFPRLKRFTPIKMWEESQENYLAMACVGPRLSAIVRALVIVGEITFKPWRDKEDNCSRS